VVSQNTVHSQNQLFGGRPVDKRAEIQHMMEGNAVLDAEHFPEISYRSTAITKTGDAHCPYFLI
jgi:hypothetical protein